MKLIKLYSNQNSFQPIEFNQSGLSIVIGCKDSNQQSNIKDTYNGVGKTLMLYIINFCLASGEIKAFKEKLPNWIFYLDFSINENKYTAYRNASFQNEIYLNNEKLTLEDFKKKLATELFFIEENIPNIGFRSLISKFMRRSRDEYANYAGVSERSVNNWDTVLILSYLLGLDYTKNLEKRNLKIEQQEIDTARKNIQNDPVIKEHFNFSGNTEIELVDLDEKIVRLTKELNSFRIAENFYDIEKQADNKATEIQAIANQEFSLENHALPQIEKSLQLKTDINSLQVTSLYKNAGLQIPDLIKKHLEDVQSFHTDLLKSRTTRLLKEKENILSKLQELKNNRITLSKEHDDLLRYLKGKGALDQRDALVQQLSDFQKRKDALSQGQKLFKQYEIKKSELKGLLDKENTETEKYLNSEEGEAIKENNLKLFRKIANEFYNNMKNGFTIENNKGIGQVRFNLHPHIEYDSSDGINEVKIFCFDWMLLLGQHRHQVKCLIHDSRLFDAMDPRQASTALRIAAKMCKENNMQYIITLNESKYNEILSELQLHEFKDELETIKKSKVRGLTDKSDQTKLLGINVDMKYDL